MINLSLLVCLFEVAVHVLFGILENVSEGRNQLFTFAAIDVSVVYCEVAVHYFTHHDFIALNHWSLHCTVD